MTAEAQGVTAEPAPGLDLSRLPTHAFGPRAPLWWGMVLLVAIEATTMGLLLVSAVYLQGNFDVWPPSNLGRPALYLEIAGAVFLWVSFVPMLLCLRAARRERLGPTRAWLVMATALGLALLVLRAFEIPQIPFRWDDHAWGSIFWMTFGLHVAHVLTGVLENGMLIALLYRGPVEEKHFGDVEASGLLWYFAVLEWVPAFAILYLGPLVFPR